MEKIFEQIASENGTTVTAVKEEMHAAIRTAMKNPKPEAAEFWKELAVNGQEPSVEEVIDKILSKIADRMS